MSQFLANVIRWINGLVGNWGVSMILFTLFVKLVLTPLDYKSRKSMRRMTNLQPQLTKLQTKYANDKEKLNQKTAELYRKEGISPMSGCGPLLISMVILYIMWAGMRLAANTEIARQALTMITNNSVEYKYESFLWIKNIWMPDSPFHTVIAQEKDLTAIPSDVWTKVFATLSQSDLSILEQAGVIMTAGAKSTEIGASVFAALSAVPGYAAEVTRFTSVNLLIANLVVYVKYNGFFILPVLSAVTQYIMTATQPQQAPAQNDQTASTNAFMKYFFPLFSLWICSSFNAIFALYWVVSNLYSWIQTLILNKIFENSEKKEKMMAEEGAV